VLTIVLFVTRAATVMMRMRQRPLLPALSRLKVALTVLTAMEWQRQFSRLFDKH
jgi:hypothetical protein